MTDICEVIERETGQPVTEDTLLEELPVDSLEFLNLLLVVSNETGRTVPDGRLGELHTVGDILKVAA